MYKDHDKISDSVVPDGELQVIDEIERYQYGRLVSPPRLRRGFFCLTYMTCNLSL